MSNKINKTNSSGFYMVYSKTGGFLHAKLKGRQQVFAWSRGIIATGSLSD